MKKILISAHVKNATDSLFCENLICYLSSVKYDVSLMCNIPLAVEAKSNIIEKKGFSAEFKFDLIIVYNKLGFNMIKGYSGTIPVFYIYPSENFYEENRHYIH